jgi:hypothetical protein
VGATVACTRDEAALRREISETKQDWEDEEEGEEVMVMVTGPELVDSALGIIGGPSLSSPFVRWVGRCGGPVGK